MHLNNEYPRKKHRFIVKVNNCCLNLLTSNLTNKWPIFSISLKLIILMINETLKLMQSKQGCGPIILMYIINIFMDPSI